MVVNNAQYQSCRLKYNSTKLKRAEKRALKTDSNKVDVAIPCKRSRSQSTEPTSLRSFCFFCGQPPGISGLHKAATFQIDKRVRICAELLEDTELLAKPSAGDMVALEAKYHAKCLEKLYNRARKVKVQGLDSTDEEEVMSKIAFAELVMYVEETCYSDDQVPVFKLSDLTNSTNQGSSGTACTESNLLGRSRMGPGTAGNSCTAFTN